MLNEDELYLNFSVNAIDEIRVNGNLVEGEEVYKNHRVNLDSSSLKVGEINEVKIVYT